MLQPIITVSTLAQHPEKPFTVHNSEYSFIPKQSAKNLRLLTPHFIEVLKQSARQEPKIAESCNLTNVVRKLIKSLPSSQSKTELKTELVAFRLGISSRALQSEKNPGFKEFAEGKPPLAPYLAYYEDVLQERDDGTILIRRAPDGVFVDWSEAKPIIDDFRLKHADLKTVEPCFYGQDGLQAKNRFEWRDLEPIRSKILNKNFTESKYFAAICSCTEERPKLGGDHSWIRLVSQENDGSGQIKEEIYSVGLYSPYGKPWEQKIAPLAVQKGFLQIDTSEFYPYQIDAIQREINQNQFTKIKETLERHKQEEIGGNPQLIQLCGRNCTAYAMGVLRGAGVDLPDIKENGLSLLGRTSKLALLGNAANTIDSYFPLRVSRTLEKVTAVIVNVVFLCAGAGTKHRGIEESDFSPRYTSLQDIFSKDTLLVEHPWGVRRVARKEQGSFPQSMNQQELTTEPPS
jgi:hypothetical protein